MRINARIVRKVQQAVGCDYITAEQLIRETNTVQEAINLGRKYMGG